MMQHGMNRSSRSLALEPIPEPASPRRFGSQTGKLRALFAAGLLSIALLVSVMSPAETSARYKSMSCEGLLGMIRVTQELYSDFYDSGQYGTAEKWGQLSLSLQDYYLSLGCNSIDADSAT